MLEMFYGAQQHAPLWSPELYALGRLCVPLSCGKTDYRGCAGSGAGPWPMWLRGCALCSGFYLPEGRVGFPCGWVFDPGGHTVAAGPLIGGTRSLALTGRENSKMELHDAGVIVVKQVPQNGCCQHFSTGGVPVASCLPGSKTSKQVWPFVLSN